VTLLFTDIVGSTRLWEQHGDAFIPVWQAHDAIVRDGIRRFGGYEVKSEGDAFMVAFADPDAAVQCALFVQAALARYPWQADIGQPNVRMGLHTGEPLVHGKDYFGPVVYRASHVCSAAHGGQVLITDATRDAMQHSDPRITVTQLGDFRLKDMHTSVQLHEARHPSAGAGVYPPPRTLDAQPNNLPLQSTSFVGRANEIQEIAAYLAQGETPVFAVTGPGGIGKTRLTLQAAAETAEWFPDGVWVVRLNAARDVDAAAREVAEAMEIPLKPGQPALDQIRDFLADRRCLLILDDAGAVPQVGRLIREIVSGTAGLRCVATARESLRIEGASEMALSGLPVRAAGAEQEVATASSLAQSDAGRLFLDRAFEANPALKLTSKETIEAIRLLEALDGVPNSIEKAAQLMDRIPPSLVVAWLDQKLPAGRVAQRASQGVDLFRGIMRRGAQRVVSTMEQTTRTSSWSSLGQLLQGIADVATDRLNQEHATHLGRESLRVSQEAGDDLGVAAALRQLARLKWQQGDRQGAVAMLSAAVEVYRAHNADDYPESQRELEDAREQLEHAETQPATVEYAVNLAMGGRT